jgi:predicted PurR-regulated permease PerM
MLSTSRTVRQRVAVALIVAVGIGVLVLIAPYIGGLLLAMVLHVVVAPTFNRLTRYMSRGAAAGLVIVGILVLLIGPTMLVISMVVAQLPGALSSVRGTGLLSSLSELRIGPIDIGARLGEFGGTAAAWVAGQATGLLGGAASTVLDLIIALFGVYYLLCAGEGTWRAVRPYIPFTPEHADELRLQFEQATRGTLLGSVLIAVLQGLLIGIAFWMAGLNSAPFWGVVATVASLIPLVGSAVVWVPGVIALAIAHRYGAAIAVLAFCAVVVASVDNFVRPIISQRISDVHPMITLIGAFAGLRVFGLLGLILGPLSVSYFFVLLRMYREEYSPLALDAPPNSGIELP